MQVVVRCLGERMGREVANKCLILYSADFFYVCVWLLQCLKNLCFVLNSFLDQPPNYSI